MFDKALEVLNIIENNGFEAYIVGGYVRDIYIGRKSSDIDISTSAKPMDLSKIFSNLTILDDYGAVKLSYKGFIYDITTFRKDGKYKNNRFPIEIEYTTDISEDRMRRDFIMNTLYMDKNGNIIDPMNAKSDIDNKIIRVNGIAKSKIKEDSLRILRAIRFATILEFNLDKQLIGAIKKYRKLLLNLSYTRKKDELNRIFMSQNFTYGLKLISDLKLSKFLEISGLNSAKWCSDVLGIWAQIEYNNNYQFSNLEKDTIKKIREILLVNKIDEYVVYKYGNYLTSVAAEIKDIDKKYINDIYNKLPIYEKKDINISIDEICKLINIEPSEQLGDIIIDLEKKIVYNKLKNENLDIKNYLQEKYRKEE